MAEIRWIKIVTDIFDDEKILLIETLPEADSIIVIWFKLLCLAGKQNNSGVFVMSNGFPYTETMLATIFRRKPATVNLALQTFEQFGMIEIINDTVTIPNWGKHQNLDKIEAKNAYMREYMSEYRSKQRAITSGKANSKANVISLEENREDKNREEKIDIFSVFSSGNESLLSTLHDFEKMRKTIKAPMTEKAKQLLIAKLEKTGGDSAVWIELLNEAIEKSWKSVYPKEAKYASDKRPAEPTPDRFKNLAGGTRL